MILQKVKPTIQLLDISYVNRPNKGPKRGVCSIFPYIQVHLTLIRQALQSDFQVPLTSLTSMKAAESSLARGHMGGGLGIHRVGTREPAMG